MVKSGIETTTVTCVEWFRVPLVPVIVRGKLPPGVVAVVVTVKVVWPVPVTDVGLKDVVVFEGTPEMSNVVAPEKPFTPVIEIVYDVALPRFTVWLDGVPEIVKSGTATDNATVVEWLIVPSLPVIVSV